MILFVYTRFPCSTKPKGEKQMLFTPVLKTKQSSEYHALSEAMIAIEETPNILPYIECIKSIDDKCVKKYIDLLGTKINCFIEPLESDVGKVLEGIDTYKANCTIVFRITKATSLEDIKTFILTTKQHDRHCGIKIDDADDRYFSIFQSLSDSDYLFIELGGTAYTSSDFLGDIINENLTCKIIIHSNERAQYLRGEDFKDLAFNDKANFNFSVIDAIKAGSFVFDGFGSRCTAKDDNTEEVKRAKKVYGVFLIYDYSNNNIYSVRSNNKDHISRIYNEVRDKIEDNMTLLDSLFFNHSPIAKKTLDRYLALEKTSSSRFITISIIRYIEEIAYNLV